jgi:hypothetical protein
MKKLTAALALIAITSLQYANADEFQENSSAFEFANICSTIYRMADKDAMVAGHLGINVPDAAVRITYFDGLAFLLTPMIKPAFGDKWESVTQQMKTDLSANLPNLWRENVEGFTTYSAKCEDTYQNAHQ